MNGVVEEALLAHGALLEALPTAAYVCDRDGVIRQYNKAAASLWGAAPERGDPGQKFCGSEKRYLLDGSLLPRERTPMADVLRGTRDFAEDDVVIERPDRSRVAVSLKARSIRDNAGRLVGGICCFYDVTAREQAEDARRKSEARLLLIADNLPALIGYLGRDHRFEFINRACEAWFGRTREQLTGAHLREALGPAVYEQRLPYLEAAFRGQTVRFEGAAANAADPHAKDFEIAYVPDAADGIVRGLFVMVQDISDRKRFERVLKKSEERYKAFVSHSSEGIYCWELGVPIGTALAPEEQNELFFAHAQMAECNDAMARMYGFTEAGELIGARPADLLVPGDVTNEHMLREFVRRGYQLSGVETVERDLHGGTKIFLNNMFGIVEKGHVLRVWGTQQDITHRKQAEATLRETTDLLEAVVNASPLAIMALAPDGTVRLWSRGAEQVLGWTRDEVIGKVLPAIPEDRRVELLANIERTMRGDVISGFETQRLRKGGEPLTINLWTAPLRDASGTPVGIVSIMADGSERKHAEDRIRAGRQQLQVITDAVPVYIAHCDTECRYLFVNQGYAQRLGVEPEQLIGRTIADVLGEAAYRSLEPYVVRVLAGETVNFEVEVPYRTMGPLFMRCSYVPYRDADGRVNSFVSAITNITDRKLAEEELRLAKQQAEAASAAKDQFLAVLSHELRTPLTPVVMTVAAMEMDPTLSAQARQDLGMIRRNIELETKLIDDLLDVTRIANGKLRLQMKPNGVHTLLRHVIDICRGEIVAKRLDLRVELEASSDHILADGARLQQVFWNLLKNSVKFTPEGGRISLRTSNCDGQCVCVEVSDTGIGIEPAALSGIFNAFEQGNQSITRQFGGLGLGLAISKALVELHGGSIRAESRGKGHGASFTVVLPLTQATERAVTHSTPSVGAEPGPGVRILVAEDHQDTSRILTRLLEGMGYAVEMAGSVTAAVQLASRKPFDILISDIGLPDASGLELMRELKRRHGMSGIAVSGFGMDADLRASHEAGFAAHLTKPIDFRQLEVLIRQIATERREQAVPRGDAHCL